MIFARIIAGAAMLLGGATGAQLPEFTQQYSQRLGGALDELTAVVERFDATANSQGLTRLQALDRHLTNADDLFKRAGRDMTTAIARQEKLAAFKREVSGSSSLGLVAAFATHMDAQIARATLNEYKPAVPVTTEGGLMALIGAIFGWLAIKLGALPFHLFRRKAASAPQAR